MRYRRARTKGGTFFFTVVVFKRGKIFCNKEDVSILREAFKHVSIERPFEVDAAVILPDHIHTVWTLPDGDSDFSTRWRLIKHLISIRYMQNKVGRLKPPAVDYSADGGADKKSKQKIWQQRFWEHQIRDDRDFAAHVDYIHYNPVKHGYVKSPRDWKYSSFHRYVKKGLYDINWGTGDEVSFDEDVGNE
jgi:putative transposase